MKLKFKEICSLIDKGEKIKIKTPFGYDRIINYYKKISKGYKITFDDNSFIECGVNHLLLGRDKELKWIPANQLKINDIIYGENYNSYKTITKIEELSEREWIDFEMESKEECYIQNDITHHNSGKSLTQSIIAAYLAYKKGLKVVLIVPNVSLTKQFESDMKEYFANSNFNIEDDLHIIYAGKEKHFHKKISITTWASVFKSQELFDNVDCIIVDEVQQAKNMEGVLNDILVHSAINTKYKFGFTGSIPRGRVEELTLYGAFGKINKIISTKDLIDKGFGTPIDIISTFIRYGDNNLSKIIKRLTYQQEKKLLQNLSIRNEFISNLTKNITKKFGNSLVLFDNIEHGYNLINEFIKEGEFIPKITHNNLLKSNKDIILTNNITDKSIKTIENFNKKNNANKILKSIEDYNIYFIYGGVDADDRELIRKKVENKDNFIIIANYKTFSVGINIKNLHNLVLASSTKGFERLVQSIGRTIRKMEGKFKVRIFDLIDDFSNGHYKNYGMKHFEERLSIYLDEEHPIKEKNVYLKMSYDEMIIEIKRILDIDFLKSQNTSDTNIFNF